MKTINLFPHRLKVFGWVLLIPGFVLGVLTMYFDYEPEWLNVTFPREKELFVSPIENLTNELAGVMLLCGLMLVAFSRRKQEDEFTSHMRLDALLWAVYCNSLFILFAIILIYGGQFYSVLIYNMFTIPVIYLLRFQYLLIKANKEEA
jgi:hypothetical protein